MTLRESSVLYRQRIKPLITVYRDTMLIRTDYDYIHIYLFPLSSSFSSSLCLSVSLPPSLSVCLSLCLSRCLCLSLSVCLFVCPVCLSLSLSLFLPFAFLLFPIVVITLICRYDRQNDLQLFNKF